LYYAQPTRTAIGKFDGSLKAIPAPDLGAAVIREVLKCSQLFTAGNAPGLNSTASVMMVAEVAFAKANGLTPIARIVSYGIGAVEPDMFGLGPIPAVKQALERVGWKISDVERAEINEAFAAIAIAVTRELGFNEAIVLFCIIFTLFTGIIMARAYHRDLRFRAIGLLESGTPSATVAQLLQVGIATVYLWLRIWKREGRSEGLSGYQKGHSHKITDNARFEAFILEHPDKTQKELGALWEQPCCGVTIGKGLQAIGYTYKKRVSL